MVLSDFDLENAIKAKRIIIKPFSQEIIRENGIDMRLSNEISYHNDLGQDFVLDPTDEDQIKKSYGKLIKSNKLILNPKEQVLLSTYEYLSLPDDVVGFVELRSTWARHGLSMPPTIIDAGFKGTITLEVINNAPFKILLRPKQRFAHIIFIKTSNKVKKAYVGSYLNQRGIKFPKKIDS
ncbi:MAG: dCTP deaminase [Nitrososphaeria archaeon]